MIYLKTFSHHSGLMGLILFLALATQVSAAENPLATRPNILLIMADDMGYTDIGCFGGEIETPNIDSLAAEGVRFTSFHTSVSCSVTRSMLMTGTDNHIAGLGNMAELMTPEQKGKPGYEGHLNDRVVTLAEVLRAGGYHTYQAGKWHLGEEPEQIPYARGFQRAFGIMVGGSHWHDMTGIQAVTPVASYVLDNKTLDKLPRDFYSSKNYADFTINSIRKNRGDGKPFLAYLAFQAPHDPLHVPEPWLSKYRGKYDDGYEALKTRRIAAAMEKGIVAKNAPAPALNHNAKPWKSLSRDKQAWESRAMEVYAGMVENMDYHIGRVISFLKDIGEYDNTLIIFTSDNGPNPWYSEDYPSNAGSDFIRQFDNSIDNIGRPGSNVAYGPGWASASAGPLDYFKMTTGEGGIRTPLILVGPGVKGPGKSASFAYVTDIMPTILELTGAKHPDRFHGRDIEPMRGRSLAGVISGENTHTYRKNEAIGGEMMGGKWMRKGAYKAVLVAKPYGPGEWRLYDTTKDPGETADLSTEHPEILEELVIAWGRYAKDVGVVVSE